MRYVDGNVKDLNIAYIGGGSRGWAWGLMSDLASEEQLSGTVKLYDIDFEAAKNNETIGNSISNIEGVKGFWKYQAVNSLKEALTGADFVIISILPGTFNEMRSDVHAPEKYGIYQSVGDTTGPGGVIRALRTIPMYIEIAENIKEYSSNAWVINYTNPMGLCTRTLYKVFPDVKAFGCCHEVFGTQKLLANMLHDMKGIDIPERDEIKINVLGINHFTWINKASYKGENLIPLYRKFVDKYYEEGFEEEKEGHWMNDSFSSANRVKFDLFNRYGLIAAAGDRHLAEFTPNTWYLKDPEVVKSWKFGLTTVDWRMKDLEERLKKSKSYINGEEKFKLKQTGEEGVHQMKALLGLGDLVTNINIPNRGQVAGIPLGVIVETNALLREDSISQINAGSLPSDINGLVLRNVMNLETIIEAAFTKDLNLAYNAFVNDPLMTIGLKESRILFDEMIYNTKEYLKMYEV
ncbi:alpha-glucosidase/alpha-galactosidase [Clostridium sp. SHJSY1]|uniref:family 4 glycosyl hydrolase n=1 Tax=Clostridium sp. SHJSY1 TaxID=2942483 RepID=UPI0028758DF3|nr:alpha-glucosidase/alpha-galactosidase [Clostridium sp. SHJSY1]MDS0524625.1 alpha-glucosidase/alpha-galactosidase [Clostridium sp. SHJSY1]